MDVILHIGAHHTDGGALLRSLLKNAEPLARHSVAVPGPSRYRKLIGTMVNRLRGEFPTPYARDAMLEALVDGETPERVFLSSESFICVPERVLDEGTLYARTFKTRWLRNLFPEDDVIFAIGMRNPAALVSSLWSEVRLGGGTYAGLVGNTDLKSLRWSDVISRIRAENTECPIITWCNEDTPFIWPELMHLVTGVPMDVPLEGEDDMLTRIMQRAGMLLFRQELSRRSGISAEERNAIAAQLLEEWVAEDQMEEEIDLPRWSQDDVDRSVALYESDLDVIREMPGVVLVEP